MEPAITDIKAVKDRHSTYLLSLPNVTALGIGPKMRHGAPTGQASIKVFVARKLPLEELAEDERIPEELEGIPTDVEFMAPLRAR